MILRGFRVDPESWRGSCLMFDRSQIEEGFGHECPYWCERCGPIRDLTYYMTYRQTWETPEEGDDCCDRCGSADTGEIDGHEAFKLVKRSFRVIRCA